MKKILIGLFSLLAMTSAFTASGESAAPQENGVPQDSTVNVIACFGRHETVDYWVNKSVWKIKDTDTIHTASLSMKVRVNVVDSTAKGYKIDYTFLEFPVDTLSETASAYDRFMNQTVSSLSQKIVGTTVHFETDEFGRITKYSNLDQIGKQAKTLFSEAMNEFANNPEIQELKAEGFDIKDYEKNFDTDKLVDDYLEELNLLFMNYGKSFDVGEISEHEDATDTEYENTSFFSASTDPEDGTYHILVDVVNIMPQSEVKDLVGGVVGSLFNTKTSESLTDYIDAAVKTDATYEECFKWDYFADGWPYIVVGQKSTIIGKAGKIEQTVISLDPESLAD